MKLAAIALALCAMPALARPPRFEDLRRHTRVLIQLPAGACQAVVTRRVNDLVSLKLVADTPACGKRAAQVSLSRAALTGIGRHPRSLLEMPLEVGLGAVLIMTGASMALGYEKGVRAYIGIALAIAGPGLAVAIVERKRIYFDLTAERLEP